LVIFLPSPALAAFVTLSGTVTDQNGAGIFGVQINFVDSCTGVGRNHPTPREAGSPSPAQAITF